MGTNILFWNCQGIRPKHNELELYLKQNIIDVITLNEKKSTISKFQVILSERTDQQAKEEVLPSFLKMAKF